MNLILPEKKAYRQWRAGRPTIYVCAMTTVFMLGGVMSNLNIMGEFWAAAAIAALVFALSAYLYIYDAKALGLRDSGETSSEESLPQSANDPQTSRRVA